MDNVKNYCSYTNILSSQTSKSYLTFNLHLISGQLTNSTQLKNLMHAHHRDKLNNQAVW
jgi:hypothetical protein